MAVRVTPLGDNLPYGARVLGLTEESLRDEPTRRQLRALFQDRGLLVFADVEPTDQLQIRLGEVFGPTKDYGVPVRGGATAQERIRVKEVRADPRTSTIVEIDGEPLSSWLPWHFDQCYLRVPNRARLLRCRQVAPWGGLTGFLDGVALHASMSRSIRERLEGAMVLYEMDMHLAHLRFGVPDRFRVLRETPMFSLDPRPTLPRASHPALTTCGPGRRAVLVSPWMAVGLVGRTGEVDPDGDELLEAASREVSRVATSLAYFHPWRLTDMVLWDNLRMLHSVTGCDPASERIMCRTTVMGPLDGGAGVTERQ